MSVGVAHHEYREDMPFSLKPSLNYEIYSAEPQCKPDRWNERTSSTRIFGGWELLVYMLSPR